MARRKQYRISICEQSRKMLDSIQKLTGESYAAIMRRALQKDLQYYESLPDERLAELQSRYGTGYSQDSLFEDEP